MRKKTVLKAKKGGGVLWVDSVGGEGGKRLVGAKLDGV